MLSTWKAFCLWAFLTLSSIGSVCFCVSHCYHHHHWNRSALKSTIGSGQSLDLRDADMEAQEVQCLIPAPISYQWTSWDDLLRS